MSPISINSHLFVLSVKILCKFDFVKFDFETICGPTTRNAKEANKLQRSIGQCKMFVLFMIFLGFFGERKLPATKNYLE